MIELAVAGASGRMGRCVLDLAARDNRFTITAALVDQGCPTCGSTIRVGEHDLVLADRLGTSCEVLVDFTTPSGTAAWVDVCERFGVPIVIGTTGHGAEQLAKIRDASRVIPVFYAANFSVGVHALCDLAARVAKELGDEYDIEVVEVHHRHKTDAPSGTAFAIVDRVLEATGRNRDDHVIFGRHGESGERPRGQIAVHAMRLGDTVGRHEIHFSGNGETLTFSHTAQSRETFAAGALRAAAWIVERDPGLYHMPDLIP